MTCAPIRFLTHGARLTAGGPRLKWFYNRSLGRLVCNEIAIKGCYDRPVDSGAAMARKMEPQDFRKWRKSLGMSQKDAADALGLKRRMIQYYEKGERDGEPVQIPLSVALACYALSVGVVNYRGPTKKVDRIESVVEAA